MYVRFALIKFLEIFVNRRDRCNKEATSIILLFDIII